MRKFLAYILETNDNNIYAGQVIYNVPVETSY